MQQQDEHQQQCSSDSALYDRYAASIFAYARLYTTSWQDAEDLTLEVFLAAWEHDNLSWLSDKQRFVWLRRVAHNRLVDNYRHSTHPTLIPLEQVVETVFHDEALTPEQLTIRREELDCLYKAVGKLPLLQQQVLQLRYEDGLRFADIAILLDKREATVRKLYSRTLARLRTIYEQQEGG
jgi:RNA polymerase sigma-70 factor (ECF subfamily)